MEDSLYDTESLRRFAGVDINLLREGTMVDASIISAPRSTKHRDPDMMSTRKGNTWDFGMKVHVGSDTKGRVHSVVVTDAAVHDSQVMADCLHGDEQVIYGDKTYVSAQRQQAAEARGVTGRVSRQARPGKRLCGALPAHDHQG